MREILGVTYEEYSEDEDLKIYGVLITRYDRRKAIDREIQAHLPEIGKQNHFNVFKSTIRVSQEVEKSQAASVSLLDAYPNSYAAQDYISFAKELLKIVKD